MPVLKLRQNNVRALPHVGPGAKYQCIYWDQALPCFGLRVHPSGRRVCMSARTGCAAVSAWHPSGGRMY